MTANTMRTFILLAALTGLFGAVGYLIGGPGGAMIALIIAGALNVLAWWNSDKMVLKMHGAREIAPNEADPALRRFAEDTIAMADRAHMPRPRVYVIDTPQPNAFATGRDPRNAAVAATTGLLARLTRDEVAGVMAHELAHVKNRDTLTMTVTATLAGAIGFLANFALFFGGGNGRGGLIGAIALAIFAPMAAGLVQMAISRSPRIRGGPGGRGNFGQSDVAGRSAGEDRARRAHHAQPVCGAQPRHRPHVHHQSPERPRGQQSVLHPPRDGQPHRPAAPDGGRGALSGRAVGRGRAVVTRASGLAL